MVYLASQTSQVVFGTLISLFAISQTSRFSSLLLKRYSGVVSNMVPARTDLPFEASGSVGLQIGTAVQSTVQGSDGPTMIKGKGWALPAGAYTARQIVEANAPLLETVLHHLGTSPPGEAPAREMLLDNLSVNLSLGKRESTLTIPVKDPSSAEMAKQGEKIGKTLVQYARNIRDVQYDPGFVVRSPCEGHLLKPEVAYLMFGPRSLGHLMQIYNEYLHQMVLLRDSLLPYENYEDVVVPIDAAEGRKRGIRPIEEPRAGFLMEMMTKQTTQASVVNFSKSLLAPSLSADNAYGFQYEHGLILPSFVTGSSSLRLLRFIPAVLDRSKPQVAFQYQLRDYYTAPRAEIPPADASVTAGDNLPTSTSAGHVQEHGEMNLVTPAKSASTTARQLQLSIEGANDTGTVSIDLGQIARGRRYAYAVGRKHGAPGHGTADTNVKVYSGWKVLTESGTGLVSASDGVHLIKAASNVELLALLGKIYPENVVVIQEGESLEAALAAGKGLPDSGRFVIQTKSNLEPIMPT
ncbi:MAG: hypothetical protein M1818_004929 [Claussenomyces sp. TS43310]|nr:MAG: hypothetical protein M1818_004929 [Claussenomyces sp. TS43310]